VHAYTVEEMNAAIVRVETAKQNHPRGWTFLKDFGLSPVGHVQYAFINADAHVKRLHDEDPRVIYSAAWLNGLAIGVALGEGTDAPLL
jgi:hypothetical protein